MKSDNNNEQAQKVDELLAANNKELVPRSPSPSAISTASSGSPLIRSDSSSSSQSTASASGRARRLSSSSPSGGQSSAAKRPTPASIAAAQLQQQQQRLQQAQQQQQVLANNSIKSKHLVGSGNKLAHMARMAAMNHQSLQRQEAAVFVSQPEKKPKKAEEAEGGNSLGYQMGKMIAYRTSRFNEFWSVNKMRYMNLACLLMTLVCLFTILLFSKSTSITPASSAPRTKPVSAFEALHADELDQMKSALSAVAARVRKTAGPERNSNDNSQESTQDPHDHETETNPLESIDSVERQPFVRLMSTIQKVHSPPPPVGDEPAANDGNEPLASSNSNSPDGFNLFDDVADQSTSSQSGSSKRALEDLVQDARRQLKRQQESEREAEEAPSATTISSSSTTNSKAGQPLDQLLGDLDGFGLFKSIKAQLLDQLANSTAKGGNGAPVVKRTKNGATIIMSFGGGGGGGGSGDRQNSSAPLNETLATLPSFIRNLLPPLLFADGPAPGVSERRPTGFASITIKSEPIVSRTSGSLLGLPAPFGGLSSLFEPFASLRPAPFFAPSSPPPPLPLFGFPPSSSFEQRHPFSGGLMSMILRASGDLANQLANKTTTTTNSTTEEALKSQASQPIKVKVSPSDQETNNKNGTWTNRANSTTESATNNDDEVETFDVNQLLPSLTRQALRFGPLVQPPFQSIYRSPRPSLMMISSQSAPASTIISGESSSSSAGGSDHLSPFGPLASPLGSPPPLAPFSMMAPHLIMMGGSGGGGGGGIPSPTSEEHDQMRARAGPSPMLRSLLRSIMSDLADDTPTSAKKLNKVSSAESSSSSRRDDHEPTKSNEEREWAADSGGEQQPAPSNRVDSRLRALDELAAEAHSNSNSNSNSNSEEEEEPRPSFMRFPPASMMLEQMLGGSLESKPLQQQHSTTFGTIRQMVRGPNGVTFERVIEMPPREVALQAVPSGVRSQSISRVDSEQEPEASRLQVPSFARLLNLDQPSERADSSTGPFGLFSRLVGDLGGSAASRRRMMNQENEREEMGERPPAHQAFASSSPNDDSEFSADSSEATEAAASWSPLPRVRVASARIRLMSARSDQPAPAAHFSLPAASSSGSPFTSPSSPLFGFPALKPLQRASENEENEEGEEGEEEAPQATKPQTMVPSSKYPTTGRADEPQQQAAPSGNHRRQRSFVYHSNHELAANHKAARPPKVQPTAVAQSQLFNQQQQVESRSSRPQPGQAAPLPPAASVVMGRRLDEFVEQ